MTFIVKVIENWIHLLDLNSQTSKFCKKRNYEIHLKYTQPQKVLVIMLTILSSLLEYLAIENLKCEK